MMYLEMGATRVEERDKTDPHKRRNILEIWKCISVVFMFKDLETSNRNVKYQMSKQCGL